MARFTGGPISAGSHSRRGRRVAYNDRERGEPLRHGGRHLHAATTRANQRPGGGSGRDPAAAHAPTTDAPALPGSKYYTLRYLLNALLAAGESVMRFPARSEDTAVLVAALRALGARVRWEREEADWRLRVAGTGGRLQAPPDGVLRMGNAGAVLRLLLGIGALLPELRLTTDHPDSLGRRPNADLLAALESLGIQVEAQGTAGCLPITLRGGPPRGGAVSISGARSSQYLSALLYLAPQLPEGLTITVPDDAACAGAGGHRSGGGARSALVSRCGRADVCAA